MVVFKLENCNNCTSLPSLELLRSLKDLKIQGMPRLERIHFETPLKSLEILCFENLQEWQYWNTKRENEAAERFPCLRELSIIDCPKLTGELPNCLPSLERLFIKKCTELIVSFSSFSLLSKLEIDDCKGVMCNSTISADFPSVNSMTSSSNSKFGNWIKQGFQKVLKIVGWKDLMNSWQDLNYVEKPLRGIHGLIFLKELYIVRCTSIVFFTEINLLPNLSSRTISNWEALESFLEVLKQSNLESLVIRDCDSLTQIARDTLPPSLTKLEIRKCENLKELEDFSTTLLESLSIYDCLSLMYVSSLGQFPETLKHISIERCPELFTILFSGAQLLPKALEDLSIKYCSRLNSIGETFDNSTSFKEIMLFACEQLDSIPSGLHNLAFLQSFRIGDCPNIRISLKFPSYLQTLDVLNCPICLTEEDFSHQPNRPQHQRRCRRVSH
ncbi:putative disease resistance protein At3g14460 [Pistacia vera]|uniref:putative disease resistance protein At3g14460 n=1 Tax=Pistacia vera TaxID=55513 RepID=UPI0012630EB8|nr:putative disease resistance protein At3g14460 [Pistacia vera]